MFSAHKDAELIKLQEQYDELVANVKSYFGKEDLDNEDFSQVLELLKTGPVTHSDLPSPPTTSSTYSSSSEEVLGFGSDVSTVGSIGSRAASPVTAPVKEKLLLLAESYDDEDKGFLIDIICSGILIDAVLDRFLIKLAGGPHIKDDLISEIKAMLIIND